MAATFSYPASAYLVVRCCSMKGNDDQLKKSLNSSSIRVNGTLSSAIKVETLNQTVEAAAPSTLGQGVTLAENGQRLYIPTKKQMADPYRQGLMVEGGVGYRQTIVIRSYEVGADKTATLESILNLLQETALNHVWMSGLLGDGFGATHGMMRNDLIWVVSRMQVLIDYYPIWGEIVEIDTWVGASGKNGMRRDWLIRSQATGQIFARATSTWVMMNCKSRRLSKMPEEVRDELTPWFIEKQAIKEDAHEKIVKLDKEAKYLNSDLKPKRSDLDMNQHVNNVKYVRWMLENIPDQFLEGFQLSGITLEYRRECGSSDIVQSLCEPEEDEILHGVVEQDYCTSLLNGLSLASPDIINGGGVLTCLEQRPIRYTHLLQIKGEKQNDEIVRGRTTWKRKLATMPFST
ncbi:palmitoyl-acyl carrier protein thioesterase, chloroplastic-like [Gastrolobium bilobum]|uniref:palmitoyl-acyl carrier protein thioesterase, chloroplastic-like n=1 Tax=Gastrolobium bilobum TaxID=150636 RepID=UPI002AB186D3|nr:palmitoyl-acyl carrier protein thioesterase, chloroplastic-like [Gastrolobium bilobum]